jgi:glycosyltransferase involved in cell wall biosynthesis
VTPARTPRVAALVPTWRAAEFLPATLAALAAQTHPDLGILISDDASPDDTAAIAETYARADGRFRLIRQPRNLGWVGNVNALLAMADADYLMFAFQDDLPEPSYVARCVEVLESDPSAVLAFSDLVLISADGTREEKVYAALDDRPSRLTRALRIVGQRGSWWIPNRGVFRSSAARRVGGLFRHGRGEFSADWPWLLALSLLGGFVRVPEPLVTKIYRPGSLSRSWDFGVRSWLAVTRSAAREVKRATSPLHEKLVLHLALAGFMTGLVSRMGWRAARRAAGRGLRATGLRSPRADPPRERGQSGRATDRG